MASLMSLKFFLTAPTNPLSYPPLLWGSMAGLMKSEVKVMLNERNRKSIKECLGVRYSVKNADMMEPHIPPIATRDHE